MALKGTLKDFGIADILQLIGQQQKTGQLQLKSKEGEVVVSFKDGNIVRAEAQGRTRTELIGSMLTRAALVTDSQLEFALETQKRTLQRLGDILVAQRALTAEQFAQMVQLQTSETLFRLFMWKTGHYEFEQKDVEVDASLQPLRAESVLMEGFRRVDEWPVVKKRIASWAVTFSNVKELPPPPMQKDAFDVALEDAFSEEKKEISRGEFQSVGENERRVYGLVTPGRTAQQIIELSCLGEFETAKALTNLINLDYLKLDEVAGKGGREGGGAGAKALATLGRLGLTVLVVGALLLVVAGIDFGNLRLTQGNGSTYSDPAAQRFASQHQMVRLGAALESYRLLHGALPNALTELADDGLVSVDDLRYPWHDAYYYRRADDGTFVLLPPLH
jgi:hypothetical protein